MENEAFAPEEILPNKNVTKVLTISTYLYKAFSLVDLVILANKD